MDGLDNGCFALNVEVHPATATATARCRLELCIICNNVHNMHSITFPCYLGESLFSPYIDLHFLDISHNCPDRPYSMDLIVLYCTVHPSLGLHMQSYETTFHAIRGLHASAGEWSRYTLRYSLRYSLRCMYSIKVLPQGSRRIDTGTPTDIPLTTSVPDDTDGH